MTEIAVERAAPPGGRRFGWGGFGRGGNAFASGLEARLAGWRGWALLLLLCCVLYLPGIASVPALDRDEARFMQASRQMLETGDFVDIRFQDTARNKKPAGIHWLQAAAVALFSTADSTDTWAYRLPSFLGATAAVLLTFAFGSLIFAEGGTLTGFIGAVLLASCLLLVAEAHIAKTDAVLLATMVAAEGALGRLYCLSRAGKTVSRGTVLVFWMAQAAGVLIKGPVTPFLTGVTALCLGLVDRQWRWLGGLRPLWGLPLTLLLILPWFIAIEISTGGTFAREAVGHDLLGKVAGAQEAHGAPPGYYLALVMLTFWPSSLFLGLGLLRGWRNRMEPAERFLLCWAVPLWLVFEALPTKLPHYILPVYPALALLAARALTEREGLFIWGRPFGRYLVFGLWGLVALVLAAAAIVLPLRFGEGFVPASLLPALAVPGAAFLLLRRLQEGRRAQAAAVTASLALFVFPPIFVQILPDLEQLWLSRNAAALIESHRRPGAEPVDAVGFTEPSLVFELGTATRFVSPDQAAADLQARPDGLVLVAGGDLDSFRKATAERGVAARSLGVAAGINYSRSPKPVSLVLFTAKGD
jgi:4-amino-4-deoxy-L-arabinose transferase-like glycosyltransferase